MKINLKDSLDRQWLESGRVLLVGIAGGSGSGKSTLAAQIEVSLEGRGIVIEQDSYYRCSAHLSDARRRKINYDHPDSVDLRLLAYRHLAELKMGKAIEKPRYDFLTHSRMNEGISVAPSSGYYR